MTHPTHTQTEQWLPVVGFEGLYEVSNQGRIKSLDRRVYAGRGRTRIQKGQMLSPGIGDTGYREVRLSKNGRSKIFKVHRLVLIAFQGKMPPNFVACHNDGNRLNNDLSNLRWDTCSGNMRDKRDHGTDNNLNKTHCPRGHKLANPNLVSNMKKQGYRSCKSCVSAYGYLYRTLGHGNFTEEEMQAESDKRYGNLLTTGKCAYLKIGRKKHVWS